MPELDPQIPIRDRLTREQLADFDQLLRLLNRENYDLRICFHAKLVIARRRLDEETLSDLEVINSVKNIARKALENHNGLSEHFLYLIESSPAFVTILDDPDIKPLMQEALMAHFTGGFLPDRQNQLEHHSALSRLFDEEMTRQFKYLIYALCATKSVVGAPSSQRKKRTGKELKALMDFLHNAVLSMINTLQDNYERAVSVAIYHGSLPICSSISPDRRIYLDRNGMLIAETSIVGRIATCQIAPDKKAKIREEVIQNLMLAYFYTNLGRFDLFENSKPANSIDQILDYIDNTHKQMATELEAGSVPAGTGTEPEASSAPSGTGTEPEAAPAPAGRGTEPIAEDSTQPVATESETATEQAVTPTLRQKFWDLWRRK